MKTISYGRQTIEDDDIEAVESVLKSDWLTQGPLVEDFERALALYTGARYAVVCSSGTAALHMAYLAADLPEGSGALTTPNTFLATANAAIMAGLRPSFSDIDPATLNISIPALSKAVDDYNGQECALSVLAPVHFAGLPVDMAAVADIAAVSGLKVIEDACHALGASWMDPSGKLRKVGDSSHSDMTVFSFHPVKSITTGEGGAVTTNDELLHERLKLLRGHGVSKEPALLTSITSKEPPPWYYEMHELGSNYRITDLQCALGISQLKKLDRFIERRARVALLYDELLGGLDYLKTPPGSPKDGGVVSSHHLYVARIDFNKLGIDKAVWFKDMAARGIRLNVHYIPVHLQPYYRSRYGCAPGDFPEAERYYEEAVSLPIYPLLTDDEVRFVASTVMESLCGKASV